MPRRPSLRRFFGSAWTHRGAAFLLLGIGGGQVGSAIRQLNEPISGFGLLGQTYLAGWLWRAGVSLELMYDPAGLRAALAEIQLPGPVLSAPWLQPPALALLGWPLTWYSLEGARSTYVIGAAAALAVGLIGLGWRRPGGWNRTDWLFLVGAALLSSGASHSIRHSEATPFAFALAAWLVVGLEQRSRWIVGSAAFVLAPWSASVWLLAVCAWITGGRAMARVLAGSIAAGLIASGLTFGASAHTRFLESMVDWLGRPSVITPTLPVQLTTLVGPSGPSDALIWAIWGGSALLLALGIAALRRLPRRDASIWRGFPASWGLLLGALLLPGALPSSGLLAIPALWTAGRLANSAAGSTWRWLTLFVTGSLLLVPWPTPWITPLGVGSGAPVVIGEIGLALWLYRVATTPEIDGRGAGKIADPAQVRSHRPAQAGS